ncbi:MULTISPECIES: helix-turn-helix domain-containing protein [unclassified Pseudomonas]|uniref:helix-turn-helix domain-containing protein n=1 Tax=unclassified Pseudomonas TaxID=196821 RepID=UPI0035C261FE
MKTQNISHFRDIHVHAATVQQWSQDYSQLSGGAAESSLTQLTTERCHIFLEQINQRVVQNGVAPRGRMCFALPINVPGSVRMQGRDVDDSSLFFLGGGEEFMFHMPTGMQLLSVTFERDMFEQALTHTAAAKDIGALLRQPVIRLPHKRFADTRQRLLAMFTQALSSETSAGAWEQAFEEAVLDELLQLMTDPACDKQQRSPSSTRSFIVEKCHRLVAAQMTHAPSVSDLCEQLQISRRTLQNSFHAVAETTPLNYLRSVRLNGVRRTLMSTQAAQLSIGDAAAQWGFYHLSHFAADYFQLFAELPSQTARATIAACAQA